MRLALIWHKLLCKSAAGRNCRASFCSGTRRHHSKHVCSSQRKMNADRLKAALLLAGPLPVPERWAEDMSKAAFELVDTDLGSTDQASAAGLMPHRLLHVIFFSVITIACMLVRSNGLARSCRGSALFPDQS